MCVRSQIPRPTYFWLESATTTVRLHGPFLPNPWPLPSIDWNESFSDLLPGLSVGLTGDMAEHVAGCLQREYHWHVSL